MNSLNTTDRRWWGKGEREQYCTYKNATNICAKMFTNTVQYQGYHQKVVNIKDFKTKKQ